MIRRIRTLTFYLVRRLLFSLAGLLFLLGTLAVWRLFFDPGQRTPHADYYILVIMIFGAGLSFLVTLATAGLANRALNLPLLARLPSRVEYLAAVFLASLLVAVLLQLLLAALALWDRPELAGGRFLEIPPIWFSVDILASALALHASELTVRGWSRVYVFGGIALLLFLRNVDMNSSSIVSNWTRGLSARFFSRNMDALGEMFNSLTNWLAGGGLSIVGDATSLVMWPFRALTEATVRGAFTPVQALAPLLLLIYATLFFILAARFFAGKDIFMTE